MSQHDMDVANAGGATVRADFNAALQALASLSLGTTAPATTYAGMLWLDTTLHVLKQRNEANSAWRIIDRADVEGVLAKTANYTVLARDFGKVIDCTSGTFTLALTAAITLTDGWWCAVRNSGTGIITIDPDSSEQIDGAATIALGPGESCLVYCNGVLFRSLARDSISGLTEDATPDTAADFVRTFDASANAFKKVKLANLGSTGGLVALERQNGSGVASYDFDLAAHAGNYTKFKLRGVLRPATDDMALWARVSDDAAVSFEQDATDYSFSVQSINAGGTSIGFSSVGAAQMQLVSTAAGDGVGNGAAEYIDIEIDLENPESTTTNKIFRWDAAYYRANSDGVNRAAGGGAHDGATVAITDVQLLFETGNIAAGDVTLYGVASA